MSGHLRDEGPLPEAALRALAYENERSARIEELERALRLVEFGSCDGCGAMHYCPVCGSSRGGDHAEGCPVGEAVSGTPEVTEAEVFAEQGRFDFGKPK